LPSFVFGVGYESRSGTQASDEEDFKEVVILRRSTQSGAKTSLMGGYSTEPGHCY
jgi:hypothetical protein